VTESLVAAQELMKAIVYRHYGSPDVLQLEDPTARENEVLSKVRAASLIPLTGTS
jgi:NADPH:quinone reductase-like Zn-dependent oxidoreductase